MRYACIPLLTWLACGVVVRAQDAADVAEEVVEEKSDTLMYIGILSAVLIGLGLLCALRKVRVMYRCGCCCVPGPGRMDQGGLTSHVFAPACTTSCVAGAPSSRTMPRR